MSSGVVNLCHATLLHVPLQRVTYTEESATEVPRVCLVRDHWDYTSSKGDPKQMGIYFMIVSGTGILNNYHVYIGILFPKITGTFLGSRHKDKVSLFRKIVTYIYIYMCMCTCSCRNLDSDCKS